LRAATDRWALSHKRPTAFMLTYGNLAMRRARSQFSANFFGCAGYKIIDNNGFDTIQQGVDAALKSDAEIIVICSADEDYPVIAPEILDKTKHKAIVVVAGYPKDSIEELKSKGLKHFIHIKSNVLDTLLEYNKMLGINS
jgi:methylmalonyl-CoA mutase